MAAAGAIRQSLLSLKERGRLETASPELLGPRDFFKVVGKILPLLTSSFAPLTFAVGLEEAMHIDALAGGQLYANGV